MKSVLITGLLAACLLSNTAMAEQRPDHYAGKASTTLDEALINLAESNTLIGALIADGTMSPGEHAELHRLTYTAENALAQLTEELEALKASLETVHLASERMEGETVLTQTPKYLDQSRALFGH